MTKKNMAKALMIQGTGSGAGKSVIVAGLCRIFRDMGIRVAPFKAQNMALNSFITKQGGEIGRAQAFQAEAAGVEPSNDMNPVLLKATGEAGCQVILNGKVYETMKAEEYYAIKDKVWDVITAAYDRLSQQYDLIVIEGAGSPAEINLQKEEVVNMRVARYTDAPVVLVGDIDRGGVFASFYGTVELLKNPPPPPFDKGGNTHLTPLDRGEESPPLKKGDIGGLSDADFIKAFIVNKFRGNIDILRPGLRMIEDKTGKPVIGVLNYQKDMNLDEEDGLSLERNSAFSVQRSAFKTIKIVVLRLKYISNFTDFAPFLHEPDVELKYSLWEDDIMSADVIIIPGSKNTVSDLLLLRESGMEDCVKAAVNKGVHLVGVCGGYQMLGKKIFDPYGVESTMKEVDGMGLLDIVTTLNKTKTTCQVEAELVERVELGVKSYGNNFLRGYEIHVGETTGDTGLFKLNRFKNTENPPIPPLEKGGKGGFEILDGSLKDNVWGTYLHGVFDNDDFRTALLNSLRKEKGLPLQQAGFNYQAVRDEAINKWADILKHSVDICFILRQLGMEYCKEPLIKGALW
ncbi:MAG: cobyric acid synthase [Nitrospirae bacterium]|nr:cobyric acid synthase [Nitrospirota bacterium]